MQTLSTSNFLKTAFIGALSLLSVITHAQSLINVRGASITITTGDTVYVQGGMTMTNSANITLNGTIILANTASGSTTPWYDSTSTGAMNIASTGFVSFTNHNNQVLYGPTSFTNIEFNTPSTVNLSNNMTVTGTLKLTKGIINTNGFNMVVTSTNCNAITAGTGNTNYTQSWINGNLVRYMASNTSSYDFPVGNSTQGNRATLTNHNLVGITYITASFTTKPGSDLGLNVSDYGTYYMSIDNTGVWVIEPNQQPTGGSYDMACYFNGFNDLTDNAFGLVKRPATSTNGADWTTGGGAMNAANGAAGRTVAGGYALRTGLKTFSQFGIGISAHVLPITLVSFDATPANNIVNTEWIVASQHSNHYFNVQRSADGASFSTIGTIEGANNSKETLTYTFNDEHPLSGTSYYRLQQVDYDGHSTNSEVVPVTMQSSTTELTANVYPNPAKDNVSIDITSTIEANATLTIVDLSGNVVLTNNVAIVNGLNHITLNVNSLSAGMYLISVYDNTKGTNTTVRLVKA